jgi:hypothetical protein
MKDKLIELKPRIIPHLAILFPLGINLNRKPMLQQIYIFFYLLAVFKFTLQDVYTIGV